MTDDEFTGLFAAPTESADPAPIEDAAPDSESAPEAMASVSDQPPVEAPAQPEIAAQPVGPNWDDEANPYRAQAEQWRQAQAALERWQAQQATQATQRAIEDLAEGDAERQAQIHQLIDRIASPLQQHASHLEQRAVTGEKATTALWIAMQAELDDAAQGRIKERMGQLMTVDAPDQMERLAFSERDAAKKYSQALSQKDAEIAELKKQLGIRVIAADRAARGADVVDAGRGIGSGGPLAPNQATDFDSWFEAQFAPNQATDFDSWFEAQFAPKTA